MNWLLAAYRSYRFPVNLAKFLRTPFFIEHFLWLLLPCGTSQKIIPKSDSLLLIGCLAYPAPGHRPSYPTLGPRPPVPSPPKSFQPAQPPPTQSPVTMIMCTLLSMVYAFFKPCWLTHATHTCFKETALLFNVHLSCFVNFILCSTNKQMFKVNNEKIRLIF